MRRAKVLAGSAPALLQLARWLEARQRIVPLLHAVVVSTGAELGSLSESGRDLLWRVFQAPVFERLLDRNGRVLAIECDAHQGLHVLLEQPLPEGFAAVVDITPCGCGKTTPRLMGLRKTTSVRR